MVVILSVADIGTPIIHAFDQMVNKGSVNIQLATLSGIIGMVSRLLEQYLVTSLPTRATEMTSIQSRNQILNFVLNAVICKYFRRKESALAAGYRAISADLSSQYLTEFVFGVDKTLLELPMAVPQRGYFSTS
jgi:hypothetical protein